MKMQGPLIIFSFVLALCLANVFNIDACSAPSGDAWKPLPSSSDPQVVEIARFAVAEHNKQAKKSYELEKISNGEFEKVNEGVKYRVFITVNIEGHPANFAANVLKNTDNTKSLLSFIPTNC